MQEAERGKQHTCYISREGVWSDEASCDDHLFVTDSQYCYDSLVDTDTSISIKKKLTAVRNFPLGNKLLQPFILSLTDLQVLHGSQWSFTANAVKYTLIWKLYSKKVRLSLNMRQVAHQATFYPQPGFCSVKQLGISILLPECDASPLQGYPQH